jgi:hypothetical protein
MVTLMALFPYYYLVSPRMVNELISYQPQREYTKLDGSNTPTSAVNEQFGLVSNPRPVLVGVRNIHSLFGVHTHNSQPTF